jgi:GNAT superfamily N-acetyltransferase
VDNEFLPALDKLENARRLTLASYISLPRSTDVVNALRIAICPHATVDCDQHCAEGDAPCDAISRVNDRLLFDSLLRPGERSALFTNPSSILKRYRQHTVHFFYLRSEEEIGRVEVPEWVARNRARVDLTHALVLDQCRRGQGYPVALSEAHEQAVIGAADRERFWALVEDSLADARIVTSSSGKSRSKRTRWL